MRDGTEKRWDDSGMAKAMKFWPFVVGVLTLAFALGVSSNIMGDMNRRVDIVERYVDGHESRISKEEQSTVDTKERLYRIERKLDDILRAVK